MRYKLVQLEPKNGVITYAAYDNEKKDFVRKGDKWTNDLARAVRSLKFRGFQLAILN